MHFDIDNGKHEVALNKPSCLPLFCKMLILCEKHVIKTCL